MNRITKKQRRALFAMLVDGTLSQDRDGPITVNDLTIGEASRLITLGHQRRGALMGFVPAGKPPARPERQKRPGLHHGPLTASTGSETKPGGQRGGYREGECATFEILDDQGGVAAEIQVTHEGDRVGVRVSTFGERYMEALVTLPHYYNYLCVKPRTRGEQGLPPLD